MALPAPLLNEPFSNCGRGAGGVQGRAVPGHPLPGSKVVELGNACASPQLDRATHGSLQRLHGVAGYRWGFMVTPVRSRCWAGPPGWGGVSGPHEAIRSPGLILCVQVQGSSCDEDYPLKLKFPSLGNSLESVRLPTLGWGRGYRS